MKCSLHPVFYVLLGCSRRAGCFHPCIRVKWLWISVSNCGRLKQPTNLSAIFHRLPGAVLFCFFFFYPLYTPLSLSPFVIFVCSPLPSFLFFFFDFSLFSSLSFSQMSVYRVLSRDIGGLAGNNRTRNKQTSGRGTSIREASGKIFVSTGNSSDVVVHVCLQSLFDIWLGGDSNNGCNGSLDKSRRSMRNRAIGFVVLFFERFFTMEITTKFKFKVET